MISIQPDMFLLLLFMQALFSNFDLVCECKVKMLSQHMEQLHAMATSRECGPFLGTHPMDLSL